MSDAPVLDTIEVMTAASLEQFSGPADALLLVRLAALVAVDAPEASYLVHIGPAVDLNVTLEDVQNVLVAVAPIVGTPRIVSASEKIASAIGLAVAAA
jgi:alkylhydroperoxidase/carboxymuconolactone decarboxylase family protein YurZ